MSPIERSFYHSNSLSAGNPEYQPLQESLKPSINLAWMLGCLAKGHIDRFNNLIILQSTHQTLIDKFNSIGVETFGTSPIEQPSYLGKSGRTSTKVIFRLNSDRLTLFQNINKEDWKTTINEKFPWLLEKPEYIWSFITALFDLSGRVQMDKNGKRVLITSSNDRNIEFVTKLLETCGITNSKAYHLYKNNRSLKSIFLKHIKDTILFSKNVSSSVSKKEDDLAFLRNYIPPFTSEDLPLHKSKEANEQLMPSEDAAWFIGLLSLGGSVNPENKYLTVIRQNNQENKRFIELIAEIGENILKQTSRTHITKTNKLKLIFSGSVVIQKLGDLRRQSLMQTLTEKHSWIFSDLVYVQKLLEGFFDAKGVIENPKLNKEIYLRTEYLDVANLIGELLLKIGIQHPHLRTDNSTKEGIKGISIRDKGDILLFIEKIHPRLERKVKALEQLKNQCLVDKHSKELSKELLIEEYGRLRDTLGHQPSSSDIVEMRKQGKTRFVYQTYARYFSERGSYPEAIRRLEDIYQEKKSRDKSSEPNNSVQIFP